MCFICDSVSLSLVRARSHTQTHQHQVTIGFQRNGVHKKAAITRTVNGLQWSA